MQLLENFLSIGGQCPPYGGYGHLLTIGMTVGLAYITGIPLPWLELRAIGAAKHLDTVASAQW